MVDIIYTTPALYLSFVGLKNSEPINSLIDQFKAEIKEEEFHAVNIWHTSFNREFESQWLMEHSWFVSLDFELSSIIKHQIDKHFILSH